MTKSHPCPQGIRSQLGGAEKEANHRNKEWQSQACMGALGME